MDVESYAKYKDYFKYILSVIDVFSKFLYLIPVKTKSGPAVTAAFLPIFDDKPKLTSRRPVWVRTDKGKEFLNKHFQDMLRDEGIQFQVCRNPDVKCAIVERAQRTIRDYTNTLRIKIRSDISTSCRNLSGPTMTRFTRRQVWHRRA